MPYDTLGINDIPPFSGDIEFQFDSRANVFIGPNGVGKSTVLKVLSPYFPASAVPGSYASGCFVTVSDWPLTPNGNRDDDAMPQIFIPPVRLVMPHSTDEYKVLQFGISDERFDWENLLSESPYSYFDGGRVYDAMQKLCNEDLHSVPRNARGVKLALAVYKCVKDICAELLRGDRLYDITTEEYLSNAQFDGDVPDDLLKQTAIHYAMGVRTAENAKDPLYIGDLSTGTQGTFLWIWYLALRMAHLYRFEEGWERQPAVLMIDEIENHLHPTWQRRVIPALLKHFPRLQIFATTHSPFVVAGLKAGQVHLLNRDADGVITATPNEEDIVGWTMDEVLRTFMGVDDPTDERTATAARELRQLRDEGRRADEREEEQRQARMQELRRLVNRDMLAGGPRAAQRDLFEQQFAEALEKYRQAQDLNQENG